MRTKFPSASATRSLKSKPNKKCAFSSPARAAVGHGDLPRSTATTTCVSCYVHRRDWYLAIEDRRDVIEQPIADDLDVSGWELRKALRLLHKSNPPLLEWLKSPIIYRCDATFAAEFNDLATQFYSPRRCFVHYLHMAAGNARDYLIGRKLVSLKKYLDASARSSPAAGSSESAAPCPCFFPNSWRVYRAGVRAALGGTRRSKSVPGRTRRRSPVEAVSAFIEIELPRLEALSEPDDSVGDVEELNRFFRRYALVG